MGSCTKIDPDIVSVIPSLKMAFQKMTLWQRLLKEAY